MRQPIWFERSEGVVLFLATTALYLGAGGGLLQFILLFFVFDLSILAYLAGPKFGATIYNLVHSLTLPLLGMAIGLVTQTTYLAGFSLIWIAHIGFDRALGLGLKYPDSFRHTTLGMIGREKA